MTAILARVSSLASTWCVLVALAVCGLCASVRSADAQVPLGTCVVTGIVPTDTCASARLDLHDSRVRDVGEVRVNRRVLIEKRDYSVIDDAASGVVVRFTTRLRRGDRVEITGLTSERGEHIGAVTFS